MWLRKENSVVGVRVPERMRDGSHQASPWAGSSGSRSSGGQLPLCSSSCPSWVAYLIIRDMRRRSRSSASGPGLEKTLTTPISEASPFGFPRLFCPFLSSMSVRLSVYSRAQVYPALTPSAFRKQLPRRICLSIGRTPFQRRCERSSTVGAVLRGGCGPAPYSCQRRIRFDPLSPV